MKPLFPAGRPDLHRLATRWIAGVAVGCVLGAGTIAAEIKVLAAEAFQPVLMAIVPGFEQRTGHKVEVSGAVPAAIDKRIRDGEDFDLAILPPALLESLGREGAVSDGSITALARVPAAPGRPASVVAGALSASAANATLSLLILLASEETQVILKDKGMLAP